MERVEIGMDKDMVVFSSTQAAQREGFHIDEFDRDYQLYIVVKDVRRGRRKARMRAFARASHDDMTGDLRDLPRAM